MKKVRILEWTRHQVDNHQANDLSAEGGIDDKLSEMINDYLRSSNLDNSSLLNVTVSTAAVKTEVLYTVTIFYQS
jgi:hypothetical protein